MAIILTVLKWLGIVLLVILALILLILLIVLLVPFKYKARAAVDDPDLHEEFPVSVLKERTDVTASVSWLFGAVRVLVAYPGNELIAVKIFGRDIDIKALLKKGESEEEPEEETEEKETSLSQKLEALSGKIEKGVTLLDYIYRVLTGRCGRRAWRKVRVRLAAIGDHLKPGYWKIMGTVGLNDPCRNGTLIGFTSMLMPFACEHLRIDTQWDLYRCDMKAEMAGQLILFVPVKETVPLFFDKDCRKVLKKLMKAKSKLK